jgi:Polyketide cyclase / dehydrase and lipid transport
MHTTTIAPPDPRNTDPGFIPTGGALQIVLRFRLTLPAEEVFDLVAFRIPEWFGLVQEVRWDHSRSQAGTARAGVSSRRSCEIGGKVLEEEIVVFVPGRMYAYQADLVRSTLKMPIRNHLGMFMISPEGTASQVEWRQYFDTPPWPLSALVRWQMRSRMMLPAVRQLIARHGGGIISTRPEA